MRLVVSSAAPINTPDALATSVAAVAAAETQPRIQWQLQQHATGGGAAQMPQSLRHARFLRLGVRVHLLSNSWASLRHGADV